VTSIDECPTNSINTQSDTHLFAKFVKILR
jgi:hypothetical protein